jgi:hypothetical protein
MEETVQVPVSVLKRIADLRGALEALEDELEDYLISRDENLLERLRQARRDDDEGNLRPFAEIEPEE